MDRFSIREVIEQAIQTEKLGYQFYTSIAEKFKKEADFFRLFTDLADKEVAHEKTFRSLLDKVKDTEPENWQECELYLRAVVESEFFLGKNKSLPSMEQVKSIDNAVDFAVGFEKETLLYFYGIRDIVDEKDVVQEIIDEERSHITWLAGFKRALALKA